MRPAHAVTVCSPTAGASQVGLHDDLGAEPAVARDQDGPLEVFDAVAEEPHKINLFLARLFEGNVLCMSCFLFPIFVSTQLLDLCVSEAAWRRTLGDRPVPTASEPQMLRNRFDHERTQAPQLGRYQRPASLRTSSASAKGRYVVKAKSCSSRTPNSSRARPRKSWNSKFTTLLTRKLCIQFVLVPEIGRTNSRKGKPDNVPFGWKVSPVRMSWERLLSLNCQGSHDHR